MIDKLDLKIDESQAGHNGGELGEAQQSPILVMSRYSALIETVRNAAPRGVPVVRAPDMDHATVKMRTLKPGVLVVDTASTTDMAAMVAGLTAHFPTLVTVAAGQRDDNASLMQLTASGQIFRFLLVPLSHGQTRVTLEAAVAEHKRLVGTLPRMDEGRPAEEGAKKAKKHDFTGYGAFAVGLAVLLGGVWWFASRTSSESQAPAAAATPATAPPPITAASQPTPLQAELALAQAAFARGEYVEPAGKSALDYYRSALRIDPQSAMAQDGIRSVAGKILERAELALTAQQVEEAVAAVAMARDIDPQHPRLAFLDALVARSRLPQVEDVNRRIDTLVAKARELRNRGSLVAPAGGSALDTLIEARRLDPTNTAVVQGFRDLSQALLEQANRKIKAGNLDEAQSLVASARQLGAEEASLAAMDGALTDARNSAAANRQSRPAPPVKTAPTPAPVADAARDGGSIDPKAIGRGGNTKDKDVPATLPRATEPARAGSNELANTAPEVSPPGNGAAISPPEREQTGASNTDDADRIVPVASLRRIRTVEPIYPIAARRRKETGMVEVVFTVTTDGGVENVEVRKSTPADVFDDAAKKAVEQWRFDPVKVNGQVVSQRAFARLRFSMD